MEKEKGNVAALIITITCNSSGGQPVAMSNMREAAGMAREYGVPIVIDSARFAENAWFIKTREEGQANRTPRAIAQEMFSLADGATMSCKKDGIANMGGFIALNDEELYSQLVNPLILGEGFLTYGGLAGRDLDAIAVGLEEALEEDYLRYRIASTEYLAAGLRKAAVPLVEPPGGHAVFIDAKAMLPHIPALQFPGQSLSIEIFRVGGIRACEIGSVMFAAKNEKGEEMPAPMELVRLAIPRRVYTQSHMDYVVEAIGEVAARRKELRGVEIVEQPPFLRHFTAKFRPL